MKKKPRISTQTIGLAIGSTVGSYIAYKSKSSFWIGQGLGLGFGLIGYALTSVFTSPKK